MKRLLTAWVAGDFKKSGIRFCYSDINSMTVKLREIKLPKEIHRAVRGLDCLAFWKGTEYRSFLLYFGITILKDHLRYDAFEHFLGFFCAVTICSVDEYRHFLPLARVLFENFIETYALLYKNHTITSNVHNLCHLVDEVIKFGTLQTFTADPFENLLFSIKSLLRSGSNPLAQAAKRIGELTQCAQSEKPTKYPILGKKRINCSNSYISIQFEIFL